MADLRTELANLRAENEALRKHTNWLERGRAKQMDENEVLRADAARWQKMRDLMTHEHNGPNVGWTLGLLLPGDDPDSAIDAANDANG